MLRDNPRFRPRLRAPKAAAIAGMIFSVLTFIAVMLVLISLPTDLLSNVNWLSTNSKNVLLALNLIPFAGIAFLWFMGVVRDHLGENEDQFFATVFLGSGLLFLAMWFAASALTITIVPLSSSQPDRLLTSGVYEFGWTLGRNLTYIYAIKMAGVFMISTCTLFIRTGVIPRWLAFLGYLLAAIMILRIEQIDRLGWVFLLFPAWIFLVSIYILLAHYSNQSGATPTES